MYSYLAERILRYRFPILVFFAVVMVLGALQIPRLGFDFTPQQLFRGSSDVLDERESFAQSFGREDNLVSIIVQSENVYTPEMVEWLRDTAQSLRDIEYVKTAQSLPTLEVPRGANGSLTTMPLIAREGDVASTDVSQLRDLAENEPLLRRRAVSDDGTVTVVLIWLHDDIQDVNVLRDAVVEIEARVVESPPPDGTTWRLGGIPHLRQEIVESLKFQQVTFVPATALAYVFILFLLFRRFSGYALPMATVGLTLVLTTSMMVFTNSPINIINNVLPSLVFIIGVSDAIHMLVRDAEGHEAGDDRETSVTNMVRHTGIACLLTSTTTAVGFFSLLAADTQILQDFGWQAGAAVMLAYFATLFFLPAALSFLPPVKRRATKPGAPEPLLERILIRFGDHVLDRPWRYVMMGALLTALAGYSASDVKIDTLLLEVYDSEHPTYQSIKMLEDKLGGILPIEVSLKASTPDGFRDPALFNKIREIQDYADADETVLTTESVVDYHQAARAAFLGDDAQRAVMPTTSREITDIDALIGGAPDAKTGPARFITTDYDHARILLRVADDGAREQLRLGNKLNARLAAVFPADTGVTYTLTGDAYVASLSLDSFIRDLFSSLLLAAGIIFLMMTVVFRSIKLGLISVVPNTIPLLLTFGYMGVQGIDLNTTTIITFAISLGLAVDDTIHFLARFEEELGKVHDVRQAILNALNGAGRAILLTSVMLLLGLSILLFSDFVPTRYFGTLTAITIVGAVIGDLVILPPLLLLAYRNSTPEPSINV